MLKSKFKTIISSILVASGLLGISPLFSATHVSEQRQKFISYALSLQGIRYKYGGETPSGFDCSGFVMYAANNGIGIQLPHSANAIYSSVEHIKAEDREPGDLMFFKKNPGDERISHVGIYCGVYHGKNTEFEGKRVFVSAVSDGPRTGIVLTTIDERYWKNHFYGYGRFLPTSEEYNKLHAPKQETASARTSASSTAAKPSSTQQKQPAQSPQPQPEQPAKKQSRNTAASRGGHSDRR